MKTKTKLVGLLGAFTIVAFLFLYSCEKTEYPPRLSPDLILTKGTWRITSFNWHNQHAEWSKDRNEHFRNYTFQFDSFGTITATHDRNIIEFGKWKMIGHDFAIDFARISPLYELNNDHWEVKELRDAFMALKGLSPVDFSSEFVVFERID